MPKSPAPGGRWFPLSVEAYHVLGEAGVLPKNTELLYGLVYTKLPKSPFHTAMVLRLMRMIQGKIPPSFFVRSEQPITCGDSELEPDISVVRGTEEDYLDAHPGTAEIVLEVCVTSHDYDRSKLRAYATAGVKECWLALGPEKLVEVHGTPVNGAYLEKTVYGPAGEITSRSVPEFRIDLARLFRG